MKLHILNVISDLALSFLYYDRKGDEELSHDQLMLAVTSGEITIDEMTARFREALEAELVHQKNSTDDKCKCGVSSQAAPHIRPYSEIDGDMTMCTCCESCTDLCANEI
jgi:hypothetical protein